MYGPHLAPLTVSFSVLTLFVTALCHRPLSPPFVSHSRSSYGSLNNVDPINRQIEAAEDHLRQQMVSFYFLIRILAVLLVFSFDLP